MKGVYDYISIWEWEVLNSTAEDLISIHDSKNIVKQLQLDQDRYQPLLKSAQARYEINIIQCGSQVVPNPKAQAQRL